MKGGRMLIQFNSKSWYAIFHFVLITVRENSPHRKSAQNVSYNSGSLLTFKTRLTMMPLITFPSRKNIQFAGSSSAGIFIFVGILS